MKLETKKAIEDLKRKIAELVTKYEEAAYQRDTYFEELTKVKREYINAKTRIAEQDKKIEHYELKGALTSGGKDSKSAKARVNRIIKEIDKCISLLND
ncbi:MAG: hypothetical protein ACI3Y2_04935 [Candidatus Egerieousia sp.]